MAHKRKSINIAKETSVVTEAEGSDEELKNEDSEKRKTSDWTPYPRAVSPQKQQEQPLSLSKSDIQKRSPSPSASGGSATPMEGAADESNGNKDEDDDDNEDETEDDAQFDPERLKAFNMFVRLFIDENLDRIVPISKQPKEKIQAIIDACARQFPEFADRTRKRIRTYLKSCRRNKRTRDSNGWENSRPTPPHLTSIQAEQILATACENEAQNAKRMRLGLEPISQSNPLTPQSSISQSQMSAEKTLGLIDNSSVGKVDAGGVVASSTNLSSKILERPSDTKVVNGSSIFQSYNSYQKVSSIHGTHPQQGVSMLLPTSEVSTSGSSSGSGASAALGSSAGVHMLANGPTDLSVRGTAAKSNLRPSLNPVEVAAVRQLITGYRESAAFLLRSADELENLLVQQNQ